MKKREMAVRIIIITVMLYIATVINVYWFNHAELSYMEMFKKIPIALIGGE